MSNEKQTITVSSATGGTFTLSFGGVTSGAIAWNATATQVQTALEAISAIGAGNVTCTEGPLGTDAVTVEFVSDLADINVATLVVVTDALQATAATCTVATTREGSDGGPVNEIQTVAVSGTTGTWTVAFGGATTAALNHDASAAEVQAALQALASIGAGNVGVSLSGGTYTLSFTGTLAATNVAQVVPTGYVPTPTIAVSEQTKGVAAVEGVNEVQSFECTWPEGEGNADGTLSWSGYSMTIAKGDDQGSLQMKADAAFGSGNASASGALQGSTGGSFSISFQGALAGMDIATPSFSGTSMNCTPSVTTEGAAAVNAVNEVQRLTATNSPTGGTFTLTFSESVTCNWNDTAAVIQSRLESLSTIGEGNVTCSGGPLPDAAVDVTFVGTLAGADWPDLEVASYLTATPLTTTPATTQEGAAAVNAVNEQQTITVSDAVSGEFNLVYGGATSTAINYNATAATVQSALEAIPSLSGNVSCSGGPLNTAAVTVEFTGGLADTAVDEMTTTGSTLTGVDPTVTVGVTAEGAAPSFGRVTATVYRRPYQAPTIDLWTYRDLIDHLVEFGGGIQQEGNQNKPRIAVQSAYRDIQQFRKWAYYSTHCRINLTAPVEYTSLTYTASTRRLTSVGVNFPTEAVDYYVKLADTTPLYRIVNRVSATVVELHPEMAPTADITTATTGTLYRTRYPLPADMVAITSINDESRVWGDSYVTPTADVMRMERHFRDASEPFSWTIIGDPVRHGRVLWVYGYPATAQTLDFIYFRRPRPLVFDGVALYSSQAGGTVSGVTAGGAAATLSTAVGDDVPGAVIRFGRTGTAVPQGRHTANPYWFQRVITSVTSGTALTLDSVADYTVTATGYAISDPLDIPEYLIEPLLRGCEYFYLLSTDQSRARFAHDAYLRAVQLAAGCDVAAPLPAGTWTDFSDAPRDYVVNSVTVHTW